MSRDVNRWIGSGNTTADAELRYTPQGQAVLNFNIAVNGPPTDKGEANVDYLTVNLWGKGAEAIAKYMTKGKAIIIDGRIKQQRWTDKEGKKQSRVVVIAERVIFQKGNKKEDGANNSPGAAEEPYFDNSGFDDVSPNDTIF